jgi:hypothetical protein
MLTIKWFGDTHHKRFDYACHKSFDFAQDEWFDDAHHKQSLYMVSHIPAPYLYHRQSSSEFGKTDDG